MSKDPSDSKTNDTSDSTSKKEKSILTLKVAEAEQRDIGRKIARIESPAAERLNISTGDALEISSFGKKTTVLTGLQERLIEEKACSYRWLHKE